MSRVDTNIESLERTLKALDLFERQTEGYGRQASLCLDEFEEEVRSYRQKLLDRIEEQGGRRSRRRDEHRNELDQMLYEADEEGRHELRVLEDQLDDLRTAVAAYERDKDQHADQLGRLMRGDVVAGGTSSGLRGLISLLEDYLERV